MQDNKVAEYLTIDKIREVVEWLFENMYSVQVESNKRKSINSFLDIRKDELIERVKREMIKNGEDEAFYMVKDFLDNRRMVSHIKDFDFDSIDFLNYNLDSFEKLLREQLNVRITKLHKRISENSKNNKWSKSKTANSHKYLYTRYEIFIKDNRIKYAESFVQLLPLMKEFKQNVYDSIFDFCSDNNVSIKIEHLLFEIANTNFIVGSLLLNIVKCLIVEQTDYSSRTP